MCCPMICRGQSCNIEIENRKERDRRLDILSGKDHSMLQHSRWSSSCRVVWATCWIPVRHGAFEGQRTSRGKGYSELERQIAVGRAHHELRVSSRTCFGPSLLLEHVEMGWMRALDLKWVKWPENAESDGIIRSGLLESIFIFPESFSFQINC